MNAAPTGSLRQIGEVRVRRRPVTMCVSLSRSKRMLAGRVLTEVDDPAGDHRRVPPRRIQVPDQGQAPVQRVAHGHEVDSFRGITRLARVLVADAEDADRVRVGLQRRADSGGSVQ